MILGMHNSALRCARRWRRAPAIVAIGLGLLAGQGLAAIRTWTGSANSNWFDAGNWTPALPAAGDEVVITNAGNKVVLTGSPPYLVAFMLSNQTLVFSNWDTKLSATNVEIWNRGTITVANAFATNQVSNRVQIVCSNLALQPGGQINADARGYVEQQGPGRGSGSQGDGGGGGYGGKGGMNDDGDGGGAVYGSTNVPLDPGSGGGKGYNNGGSGGGAIWIEADGLVTINGTISANGGGGFSRGGGGSGGAICILCGSFAGTSGIFRANGGDKGGSNGGGGGGGRISIGIGISDDDREQLYASGSVTGLVTYLQDPSFSGTLSVTNGVGVYTYPTNAGGAYPGTRQFMRVLTNDTWALTIAGDPDQYDSPATNGYNTWIIADGTVFTNTVTTPASEVNGRRWSLLGWRVNTNEGGTNIGGVLASGAGTQAVFTVSTNLILTWLWTNEYLLTAAAAPNGAVNTATNGWYTNGTLVTVVPAADPGYYFAAWFGADVPVGQELDNPLTVAMDQARTNLTAVFAALTGGEIIWTGAGNWRSYTNWTPNGMPGSNDAVLLRSGTVTVSEAYSIGALVVSNTLVCSNWNTCLTVAGAVQVLSNGVITLPAAFTTNQMSNRVWVACSDFIINAGGRVLADERGYVGQQGPGKGSGSQGDGGGGGYGGKGGLNDDGDGDGAVYGSTNVPFDPGSGGGNGYNNGGAGGGAVRIEAGGAVTINGTVSANGGDGTSRGGGGSGGAIYILCNSFAGTNGIFRANGGDKGGSGGGGGGGGRIAVWVDVPPRIRERYLSGDGAAGRAVALSTAWPQFTGTLAVTDGLGVYRLPDTRGAYPGTCFFFRYVRGARLAY